MKLKLFLTLLIISFIFSACLVKSFSPFYLDKDVVNLEELSGKWLDNDSLEWNFEKYEGEKSIFGNKKVLPHYKLQQLEGDDKVSHYIVTPFKVAGKIYLDFFPDFETIEGHDLFALHTLPVHTLAELNLDSEDLIIVKWFSEEWLGKLIEGNKTSIPFIRTHDENDGEGTITLSASSAQLTQFIADFGNDPKAFDCEDSFSGDDYCRKLKRVK